MTDDIKETDPLTRRLLAVARDPKSKCNPRVYELTMRARVRAAADDLFRSGNRMLLDVINEVEQAHLEPEPMSIEAMVEQMRHVIRDQAWDTALGKLMVEDGLGPKAE